VIPGKNHLPPRGAGGNDQKAPSVHAQQDFWSAKRWRSVRRRLSVRSETSQRDFTCDRPEVCGDTPARGEAAFTQATRYGGKRHVRLTCAPASVGSANSCAWYLVQHGVPLWLPRRQFWAAGVWPPRRRWQGNGPLEVKVELVVFSGDRRQWQKDVLVANEAYRSGDRYRRVREPTSCDPYGVRSPLRASCSEVRRGVKPDIGLAIEHDSRLLLLGPRKGEGLCL